MTNSAIQKTVSSDRELPAQCPVFCLPLAVCAPRPNGRYPHTLVRRPGRGIGDQLQSVFELPPQKINNF
jgi:hypothetical protein